MKILLIEDDRELAESMRFQLEKEGHIWATHTILLMMS